MCKGPVVVVAVDCYLVVVVLLAGSLKLQRRDRERQLDGLALGLGLLRLLLLGVVGSLVLVFMPYNLGLGVDGPDVVLAMARFCDFTVCFI